MLTPRAISSQRGASMIEILVAIFIVVIGLLGLAGLQTRINLAEMESFQRAQAIVLMQDMVDRINANRKNGASYVTATPLGTGDSPAVDCSALTTMAARDQCEWSKALLGAAEANSGGTSVGAMVDARGCVADISDPAKPFKTYTVSVVWQGLSSTVIPGATACGQNLYGAGDRARRALVANVVVGCLENNPANLAACI